MVDGADTALRTDLPAKRCILQSTSTTSMKRRRWLGGDETSYAASSTLSESTNPQDMEEVSIVQAQMSSDYGDRYVYKAEDQVEDQMDVTDEQYDEDMRQVTQTIHGEMQEIAEWGKDVHDEGPRPKELSLDQVKHCADVATDLHHEVQKHFNETLAESAQKRGSIRLPFKKADMTQLDHGHVDPRDRPQGMTMEQYREDYDEEAPELASKEELHETLVEIGAEAMMNANYSQTGPEGLRTAMSWECHGCGAKPLWHSMVILLIVIIDDVERLRTFCECCWREKTSPKETGPKAFKRARMVHGARHNALRPMSKAERRGLYLQHAYNMEKAGRPPRDKEGKKIKPAAWATMMMKDPGMDRVSYEEVLVQIDKIEGEKQLQRFALLKMMCDFIPMVIGNEHSKLAVILKYICKGQTNIRTHAKAKRKNSRRARPEPSDLGVPLLGPLSSGASRS